ncbi:MAG: hypothetical protein COX29_02960 [Candidatus Moranbacteria bacterium CG23_combo_of_CG06-09_8_20_14_all_35_22]|nr:MAG: hypothetical protein COX29_02960 [Candidatus Moranbacteria bacterium CG23_combo_of_CG06-09_8_20_14_all_35_22]
MDEQINQNQEQQPQPAPAPKVESSDVEKNKPMAIIGYIIPILFFIPLLSEEGKKSPFAKFHANQQLNLLLFGVIGYTASAILMIILIGFLLYFVVIIGSLVFLIMGIINAAKGEMKKLPIIGGFSILK